MSDMTTTSKVLIIGFVVVLTSAMIYFHAKSDVQGIFPEFTDKNSSISNQCELSKK